MSSPQGRSITAKRGCRTCDKLTGEWDIDWPTLLRLVRLVARHPAYRQRHRSLLSRLPDDVWYEAGIGWTVTYRMPREKTLSFVVEGPAEVTAASQVARASECREL